MTADSVTFIFLNAAIVNNFVLAMFLGICPFLGVSAKRETAWSMGLAVIFVMLVSSICAYGINWMLTRFEIEYLRLICYIAVIASAVQLVEMTMKKYSPTLFRALGIFLPLLTVNCAILGASLFMVQRDYTLAESTAYGFGVGLGFHGLGGHQGVTNHREMRSLGPLVGRRVGDVGLGDLFVDFDIADGEGVFPERNVLLDAEGVQSSDAGDGFAKLNQLGVGAVARPPTLARCTSSTPRRALPGGGVDPG